jgi:hypothetical protein
VPYSETSIIVQDSFSVFLRFLGYKTEQNYTIKIPRLAASALEKSKAYDSKCFPTLSE